VFLSVCTHTVDAWILSLAVKGFSRVVLDTVRVEWPEHEPETDGTASRG